MTLDDHEIVDQFACDELGGSDDANRPTPRQYLEAALPAYMEYVHSRHPDGAFFYDFHHGMAQFFVMDTRTGRRRRSDSQMIDDVQMKGFQDLAGPPQDRSEVCGFKCTLRRRADRFCGLNGGG